MVAGYQCVQYASTSPAVDVLVERLLSRNENARSIRFVALTRAKDMLVTIVDTQIVISHSFISDNNDADKDLLKSSVSKVTYGQRLMEFFNQY